MKWNLAFASLLLFASASFAGPHEMHSVRIVSQDMNARDAGVVAVPLSNGVVVQAPINRTSNIVRIETSGHYLLTLAEDGNHPLVFTVNTDAQCYQDGNWFVFADSKSKKHKFSVIHSEKIQ